ncbi:MAG: hypothetical protein OEV42_11790 [Deltaproteobacteria bacterium]|nr:hypothetical protein [Deltaproteobacteria bacterium]
MSDEHDMPAGRKLYDNIWLLLALGIVVPTLIFTVWGLIEIQSLPYLSLDK